MSKFDLAPFITSCERRLTDEPASNSLFFISFLSRVYSMMRSVGGERGWENLAAGCLATLCRLSAPSQSTDFVFVVSFLPQCDCSEKFPQLSGIPQRVLDRQGFSTREFVTCAHHVHAVAEGTFWLGDESQHFSSGRAFFPLPRIFLRAAFFQPTVSSRLQCMALTAQQCEG